MPYQQKTFRYRTYLKQAFVQAIRAAFANHPDKIVKRCQASIEFPTNETTYPYIIVKYHESRFENAGVGHMEYLEFEDQPNKRFPVKHYLYGGHIEFVVLAQTSLDRDIVMDAITELLTMGDLQSYTNNFFKRIYTEANKDNIFSAENENFITINTDRISNLGDSQSITPWGEEDDLIYTNGYRAEIFGEMYTRIYEVAGGKDLISKVDVYPYRSVWLPEPIPNPHPEDPEPWT